MEKPRNRRPDALGDLQHLPDEVLSRIVGLLAPKDVGSMACVSSIFYVFCSEEPLWMNLCLDNHEGLLEYKGSWKLTTLEKMGLVKNGTTAFDKAPMHFNGFTSLYLYRRWYRCHMALEAFIIPGVLERREKVTQKEFDTLYDGKRPVLLTDLTEDWPAKDSWSIPRLVEKFGDIAFKVGQSHGKKVTMKFKDYASYMTQQHDEDPLYIFDSKFGKHAPALLEDYKVPYLFTEDYLELLGEQRPPFRWLVIGPCRSGASWHVDPGLTSAWNTLLCGRKRWALYPPGRVPPRVTVHVDEEDGDVNFDGPTSLQWWVDVYPSLEDEDKPIECIQYPGETIYVPSGWWHCVLNIDSSVAVTQNFVNSANFELVCLDMAPGFRHKGIARAGNMALGQAPFTPKYETVAKSVRTSAVKPTSQPVGNLGVDCNRQPVSETDGLGTLSSKLIEPVGQEDMIAPENQLDECSPLDINTLLAHIEEHPDHFNSNTSGNYLGQRVLRRWLRKLWTDRPELQPRIWQCACRVLDAETWVYRAISICEAYGFPTPSGLERLPVGNGSNPVFVIGEKVIKFYVEEGLEGSVDVLGSELEFYAQVIETGSPLKHAIPALVGSGILYPDGDKFRAVAWNGTGDVPPAEVTGMARKRARDPERHEGRVRTKWSRSAKRNPNVSESGSKNLLFCPYIVMERCSGKSLLSMLGDLKSDDMLALASFLGQQVRNLHSLSLPSEILYQGNLGSEGMSKHLKGEGPPPTVTGVDREAARLEVMSVEHHVTTSACPPEAESKWPLQVPWEWQNFVSLLREKREHISDQFDEWATIPDHLVKQVETYLPQDPATIIDFIQVEGNVAKSLKPPVWIHMDIMVDNVLMRQSSSPTNTNGETNADSGAVSTSQVLSHTRTEASHIIDFGDINFGDPVYEFIAVYLDVFRGDVQLMKRFLKEYQLPFWVQTKDATTTLSRPRPSYKAMCYVLLYRIRPGRVLMHIKESLQKAKSWEDIEERVFGFLNDWQQESLLSSSLTTATSTATDLLP